MKSIETYLFDFDGTLVDSHDSLVEVFHGAYASVGVDVPEGYVLRLMRIPLIQGYEELGAPMTDEAMKVFEKNIRALLDAEFVLKLTKSYEDVLPALIKLKNKGKQLGIVTSNNVKHVKDVLRFLNIDEKMFDVIIGNDDTEKHKPNPEPIYKAMELLSLTDKSKICYVGDALDDKKAALNAGVTAVLLDRADQYLDEDGIVITSLSEL
ncbi:MAG: HAD-IA family hydrolase [Bacilli bacterium]|nr:HAD-IA family hydrolase [Bacilli bacterium]